VRLCTQGMLNYCVITAAAGEQWCGAITTYHTHADTKRPSKLSPPPPGANGSRPLRGLSWPEFLKTRMIPGRQRGYSTGRVVSEKCGGGFPQG
jgi:hypothetical protein